MKPVNKIDFASSPVVVGGTGGSGTRLIRAILAEAGMFMGNHLNKAGDALDFVPFFERTINPILEITHTLDYAPSELPRAFRESSEQALQAIFTQYAAQAEGAAQWGFKTPRAIYVLPLVHALYPSMRFIHVIRDGRDMAFSHNKNQPNKHYHVLFGDAAPPHEQAIRLWEKVNREVARWGERELGSRYRLLRMEDMCHDPETSVDALLEWLGLPPDKDGMLAALVSPPDTFGRWQQQEPDVRASINAIAGETLQKFGYGTSQSRATLPKRRRSGPMPNILFIMADQLRHDALGVTGHYVRTPAIDSIAREGTVFTNGYTSSPECVPARVSLAVGGYPHQTGVWRNRPYALDPEQPTWMQALHEAGYRTSVFGKTHLHPHQGDLRKRLHLMHAYGLDDVDEIAGPRASAHSRSNMTDEWERRGLNKAYRQDMQRRGTGKPRPAPSLLGLADYYDVYVGNAAMHYLAQYQHAQPWMCWVSFAGPHEPWDAPAPYDTMYDPSAMPRPLPRAPRLDLVRNSVMGRRFSIPGQHRALLSTEEILELRANYAGNVSLIDDQVKALLETIRRRGEMDNTLVIFTADHGEMNGDHGLLFKSTFYDAAVRIPLIVRPPPSLSPHAIPRSQAMAELPDAGATMLDYAGLDDSFGVGRSLRPLIQGTGAGTLRAFARSEYHGEAMVADERWKVVVNKQGTPLVIFDRLMDPDEHVNLAAQPAALRATASLIAAARIPGTQEKKAAAMG